MAVADTKTAPPTKAAPAAWSIEVEAYRAGESPQEGHIAHWYREVGDRFVLRSLKEFSHQWMKLPGHPAGHFLNEVGEAIDNKGNRYKIPGHGPEYQPVEGVPVTTIPNRVRDPLQVLTEASVANHNRGS